MESELHTPGSEGIDYFGDIVADDAEAGILRVCFDNSPQSGLSVMSHRVSFVQNANLNWRDLSIGIGVQSYLPLRKFLYFLSHYVDTALVRSVQLDHSLLVEISAESFLSQGKDS